MKFTAVTLVALGLGVMHALAAPAHNNNVPRQNDMPRCENGKNGPKLMDTYDNGHCDNDCTYEEGSGDNIGKACTGECVYAVPPVSPGGGQMPPYYFCSGKWSE